MNACGVPRCRTRLSGVLVALAAALLTAAPAQADVPPGFDLFETDPEATVFSFREEFTIPPNFFDQGAEPFQGDVHLGGLPLGTFQNRRTGDADTVVRRTEPATVTPGSPPDVVPIELVALSLQSIAPIEVRVGTTTQLWDVAADPSPSRPSRGDIFIQQTSAQGGTFDSTLQVYPRFTFTRLSDRETRTLDVGAQNLSPQSQSKLVLRAQQVPWRAGCAPPALQISGFNDNFCPSFTPTRENQLTLEQGFVASHGVRPAQPLLDHFKCYDSRSTSFRERMVELRDQFGSHDARVLRPIGLCNPASKNGERVTNRRAHLECFAISSRGTNSPTFSTQRVLVRNQFGSDAFSVTRTSSLCLPSSKSSVRSTPRALKSTQVIDHFRCFRVSGGSFRARTVRIRDQFGNRRERLIEPVRLCAPTLKNRTPSHHPVSHLVCYRIRDRSGRRRAFLVRVRNQFGRRPVAALEPPTILCVPSVKVRAP
jgi:hypothetical protein